MGDYSLRAWKSIILILVIVIKKRENFRKGGLVLESNLPLHTLVFVILFNLKKNVKYIFHMLVWILVSI